MNPFFSWEHVGHTGILGLRAALKPALLEISRQKSDPLRKNTPAGASAASWVSDVMKVGPPFDRGEDILYMAQQE